VHLESATQQVIFIQMRLNTQLATSICFFYVSYTVQLRLQSKLNARQYTVRCGSISDRFYNCNIIKGLLWWN